MVCIYCARKTGVINSRLQKKPNQTWRRRRCGNCRAVFTTIEGVDWHSSLAVKKTTTLEPFSRDTLFVSVFDSVRHRKSPQTDASSLTSTIISKLPDHIESGSITSGIICEVTSETLKNFDHAAYTYYAAFHPNDKQSSGSRLATS